MCVVYGMAYSLRGKCKYTEHTQQTAGLEWHSNGYLFLELAGSLQPMLKGMDGRVRCVSKNAIHTIGLAQVTQYYLALFDTNAIMKIT